MKKIGPNLLKNRIIYLRELDGKADRAISMDIGKNPSYLNKLINTASLPSLEGLFENVNTLDFPA